MHAMRGPDEAPGSSRIARLLSWMVWIADFRGMWTQARVHYAVVGLVFPTGGLIAAVAEIAAPHAGNLAAWALLAGASSVALLAWIRFVAVPLATKGKLPDGRNLADVLARRRLAHDRRQALRQRRNGPGYRGPHAHRQPHSLPPPGNDA
jgi:hypothetical protein